MEQITYFNREKADEQLGDLPEKTKQEIGFLTESQFAEKISQRFDLTGDQADILKKMTEMTVAGLMNLPQFSQLCKERLCLTADISNLIAYDLKQQMKRRREETNRPNKTTGMSSRPYPQETEGENPEKTELLRQIENPAPTEILHSRQPTNEITTPTKPDEIIYRDTAEEEKLTANEIILASAKKNLDPYREPIT